MGVKIPISEARKRLSGLLKALQKNPHGVYEITINDIVVGELVAPEDRRRRLGAGAALLRAAEEVGKPDVGGTGRHSISRDHDRHLYGRKLK
jgi:hypothetical protein